MIAWELFLGIRKLRHTDESTWIYKLFLTIMFWIYRRSSMPGALWAGLSNGALWIPRLFLSVHSEYRQYLKYNGGSDWELYARKEGFGIWWTAVFSQEDGRGGVPCRCLYLALTGSPIGAVLPGWTEIRRPQKIHDRLLETNNLTDKRSRSGSPTAGRVLIFRIWNNGWQGQVVLINASSQMRAPVQQESSCWWDVLLWAENDAGAYGRLSSFGWKDELLLVQIRASVSLWNFVRDYDNHLTVSSTGRGKT